MLKNITSIMNSNRIIAFPYNTDTYIHIILTSPYNNNITFLRIS